MNATIVALLLVVLICINVYTIIQIREAPKRVIEQATAAITAVINPVKAAIDGIQELRRERKSVRFS